MEQDYKLTINMDSGESYYIWKPNKEDIGKIIYEIMMQEDFIIISNKAVICNHISSFEISDVRYLDEMYDDRIHPIESDYKDVALITMIKDCIKEYTKIKEEKDGIDEVQE
jgi:DNA-binding cell septation regulator SpoVG